MNRFAELLDRIAYEPGRNNKIKLIADYFRTTPDPSRGYALAAFTGALSFKYAKPALLRGLISDRVDPELFALSYDYVGDLSETIALLWPAKKIKGRNDVPTLSEIVETLGALGKLELPGQLVRWLDALDERGRWALLKLVTGGMRIGVSARLAKTAAAALGPHDVTEVELAWPGLEPPYEKLFAWLEGEGEAPESNNPVLFRPVMLAHAIEASDFGKLDPKEFVAEWKWDGIRMQAASGLDKSGKRATRLYSRTGEEITKSFPDLLSAFQHDGVLDGELLILREGRVQSFNVLQQRLNRKAVSSKLLQEFPAHIRAYDLLSEDGEDLRHLPFLERRKRLGKFVKNLKDSRVDLSPMVSFGSWDELAGARADPAQHGAGQDADAVEGVMIKRGDSVYQPGRPKGQWWKWKRDPKVIDAVLMYAQRGHGKRSSFYSDYTFGVWTNGDEGEQLVPVGKAYFGFTDEELQQIDRFVRRHTVNKFGPVREIVHEPNEGLVFEVAFEGLARSSRHKSGVAMRFPRISRLRWDKPPKEADRIEALERLLEGDPAAPLKRKRRA
ncbi:MAG: cisplatin damage response ATP-dependent DNA ligase [Xanthobacteraceae bacterium]|nr:cisplatin damage response ATP-dependent DNA ligase [Xanthobacteraceae bacterium]MCW5674680.1 cisplatin damage response ATP-dependent DNA ligase [Xanthobacteraceae bacterium]